MNKTTIIGNLTKDPASRTVSTQGGQVSVCDFSVAVNGRSKDEVTYFRVTAWRGLGETCQKYLAKGRKVCVVGPVSCRTYTGNDGITRASLEITAEDVEFLSSRQNGGSEAPESAETGNPSPVQAAPQTDAQTGYTTTYDDDLPF